MRPPGQVAVLRRSRSCLPVLKNGMCFSLTETLSPVRGLRPTRASRRFTENAPKPRSSPRPPRRNLIEDRRDDDLDIALIEMGVAPREPLDELRFRHCARSPSVWFGFRYRAKAASERQATP